MWELYYKESWAPKNLCFWIVLEKTLESPLGFEEIQPGHPKGDQSWVFFGRKDVEAETPILGPPDAKSWLIWKDPDAGKDWGQEKKGITEDEMVGWHHRLNGHEFGQTPGVGDGQGGLACCGSWDCKELDMTGQLNWLTHLCVSCIPPNTKFIIWSFQKGACLRCTDLYGRTSVLGKPVWGRRDNSYYKLAMIKVSSKKVLKLKPLLIVM